MFTSADKPISIVQAARTLYRTRTPNSEQVAQVFRLMKSGAMPARDGGSNPLKWTTTETALAEFMANRQVCKASDQQAGVAYRAKATSDTGPTEAAAGNNALERVYYGIWRDYFLAVMTRRRMAHRSVAFGRAVVAGQVVVLLLLVGLITGSIRQIVAYTASPPEHLAVENWIESQTDAFSIQRWRPTTPDEEGGSLLLQVEYRYRKDSPRWVHTKRTFRITGNHVAEVAPDD